MAARDDRSFSYLLPQGGIKLLRLLEAVLQCKVCTKSGRLLVSYATPTYIATSLHMAMCKAYNCAWLLHNICACSSFVIVASIKEVLYNYFHQ